MIVNQLCMSLIMCMQGMKFEYALLPVSSGLRDALSGLITELDPALQRL